MTRRLVLIVFLLIAVALEARRCEQSEPEVPKPAPEVQEEQSLREAAERQRSLPYEAMSQALSNLTGVKLERSLEIVLIADREAAKYDLDPFRVLAFIVAESHGNHQAKSPVGALGLMQIMPATGQYIATSLTEPWGGSESLYEIETNIIYGVWYYHHLLLTFKGDEQAALAAYNWGPETIRQRIRKGERLPIVYPRKVLEAEDKLEREFSNEATQRFWRNFSYYYPGPNEDRGPDRAERLAADSGLLADSGESP